MAIGSNLQGGPITTLAEAIQAINNLYSALRIGLPPLDATGAPSDGIVNLGGPQNRYAQIHATSINLGGTQIDDAFLATLAGTANLTFTPAIDGTAGIDLRATGRVPADARQMVISGRSGANGAGGGGGGGSSYVSTLRRQAASGGGGGGGGVSLAEFETTSIAFSATDSIIAFVGGGGQGGAGGAAGRDGASGSAGGITRIVVGGVTYAFPAASAGTGGADGGDARQGSQTTPGSGSGEDRIPGSTSYFPLAGGGGLGGPGAGNGSSGRSVRSLNDLPISGGAGGAGGQGPAGSAGGAGGRGAGRGGAPSYSQTPAAQRGGNGTVGRDGLLTILFSSGSVR